MLLPNRNDIIYGTYILKFKELARMLESIAVQYSICNGSERHNKKIQRKNQLLFGKSSIYLLAIKKGSIITKRVLLLYSVTAGSNREFDTSL